MLKELGIGRRKIYADPARPDIIEDIRRAGFIIEEAEKAVYDGLMYMKGFSHFVTRRSAGLRKEFLGYKWKEKDGVTLDEPVKFLDDGMDAGRYAGYSSRVNSKIRVSNTNTAGRNPFLDRL